MTIAPASEQESLALLCRCVQGRVPLDAELSQGSVVLTGTGISICVPPRFVQRAQVLHHAPDGRLRETGEVLASWLLNEWTQDVDCLCQHAPQLNLNHVSQADIEKEFSLLQACHYLQDDPGVKAHSRTVHAWTLYSPRMYTLPDAERACFTDKQCNAPLRLLADLPGDLATSVCAVDPFEILHRLPVGSRLAPIACEAYNAWVMRRHERARGHHEDLPLYDDVEEWGRLSALAMRAGTRLRVRAKVLDWMRYISGKQQGLHVYLVDQNVYRISQPGHMKLPSDAEYIEIWDMGNKRAWRSLRLPSTLRELKLHRGGSNTRLRLADVRLPEALPELTIDLDSVSVVDAALPRGLTRLVFMGGDRAFTTEWSRLRLPPGLKQLYMYWWRPQRPTLAGLQLPDGLELLHLGQSCVDAATAKALRLPRSLTVLHFGRLDVTVGALAGVALPQSLVQLCLTGPQAAVTGLILPPLTQLVLSQARLDPPAHDTLRHEQLPPCLRVLALEQPTFDPADHWLLRAALPAMLTYLRISAGSDTHLNSETLQSVPWPPSLHTLILDGCGGAGYLCPLGLPPALRHLSITQGNVSLRGAEVPVSLTALDLMSSKLADEEVALGDALQAATSLKRLCLRNAIVPGAVSLTRLPNSITHLVLANCTLTSQQVSSWQLPLELRILRLDDVHVREGGAVQAFALPPRLQRLSMWFSDLGNCVFTGLELPDSLELLVFTSRQGVDEPRTIAQPPRWPANLKYLENYGLDYAALEAVCHQLRTARKLTRLDMHSLWAADEDVHSWLGDARHVKICLHDDDEPHSKCEEHLRLDAVG